MKLKNIWKYTALIGFVNLIFVLLYFIGMAVIYGVDEIVPLWASRWFFVSLFLIVFSVFVVAVGNIKEIIKEAIQFLKD